MSRGLWDIEIRARLVNGQSGQVHLIADKLVTIRELRAVCEKALGMCEQLAREPATEADRPAPSFKVVGQ